jgi:SAM-dependent methyltransferase
MNAGTPDAGNPAPSLNPEGLLQLGRYLKQTGYRHIAVTPLTQDIHNRRPGRERARTLRDVLGWSLPFERTAVSPREFGLMDRAGVLETEGGLWRSIVRWSSLDAYLCAHSAHPTHEEDAVFFGPDTYRFARMIRGYLSCDPGRAARIVRAADIGCGSGAGALLVADACPRARIEALDINPVALRLARVNAELAGFDAARLPVSRSDLLKDVEGSFDLLIANPPYMLDAHERTYRHGGGNLGEGLAQDIVSTALDRLSPGGTLLLYTGVAMVDGKDALLDFVTRILDGKACAWSYEELDPDVFQDELHKPGYERVERIAAVGLTLTLSGA